MIQTTLDQHLPGTATPAQRSSGVNEMRQGLPVNLMPDVVPFAVHPREDTPHAVAAELRRSAFFRGALLAQGERLDNRFSSMVYHMPQQFKCATPLEYRFGLTKSGGDLEVIFQSRAIAWMRMNSESYAIGVERGGERRNLHLQGSFSICCNGNPGSTNSIKAHMRRVFQFPAGQAGKGYKLFVQKFKYTYGMNLESYLGYSVKDFGSSWFRHYSSDDITPERLEHAAYMRRLLDSGRDDKICIKMGTLMQQVEVRRSFSENLETV